MLPIYREVARFSFSCLRPSKHKLATGGRSSNVVLRTSALNLQSSFSTGILKSPKSKIDDENDYPTEIDNLDLRKIPKKPKPTRSAFSIYYEHRFEELKKDAPNTKKADVIDRIRKEWDDLEDKSEYIEMHNEESKRCRIQLKTYNWLMKQTITIGQMVKAIEEYRRSEAELAKERSKLSKKVASAYNIFVAEKIKEGIPLKEAGRRWREMSEEEKVVYRQKFSENAKKRLEQLGALNNA